jgi:nitrogen fixation protein FixH
MNRINWGTGIAMTYTAFALATSGVVAFAMTRRVDLVSPDYYARSLQQDRHMAAVRNAAGLRPAPAIVQTGARSIVVRVTGGRAADTRGAITLYRASDAAADRELPLAMDDGEEQRVSLAGLDPGHWIVKVRWSSGGREYYVEQPVIAR